jgi:hypothetical protein
MQDVGVARGKRGDDGGLVADGLSVAYRIEALSQEWLSHPT